MDNQITNIGIVRESRIDEHRSPIIPQHIESLRIKYPNLIFTLQPSNTRCYSNEEYENSGANINEDLSSSSIIFGVKEIDRKFLINNKTYLFFSHTFKISNDKNEIDENKRDLLLSVIDKKIRLIDYENIRDKSTARYLGFGRFAGIIGCYNTLNLCLEVFQKQPLARAYKINNYQRLVSNLKNLYFPKLKILITGDGRVSNGVIELLKETNMKEVSKNEFLNNNFDVPIYCNLKTIDYVKNNFSDSFNLNDFINNPKNYSSNAINYLKKANVLISAHYWDPDSPKIFEVNDLQNLLNLKVVGDITCDINGSIPTTIRSSTIENPNYWVDKNINEIAKNDEGIAVMAVDNLPSELPREASEEFSLNIVNEVIPFLINKDDGRILNGTIASNGSFLEKYHYLKDYINHV